MWLWIKKIEYDGGLDYKGKIIFDRKSIISSKYKKKGKSTLLRVILYALGFEGVRTNGIANLDLKTNIKICISSKSSVKIFIFVFKSKLAIPFVITTSNTNA